MSNKEIELPEFLVKPVEIVRLDRQEYRRRITHARKKGFFHGFCFAMIIAILIDLLAFAIRLLVSAC